MKKVNYSQLSKSDLQEKLKDEKNAIDKMKFTHTISPVESPARINNTRKNIARLMTKKQKRELADIKK